MDSHSDLIGVGAIDLTGVYNLIPLEPILAVRSLTNLRSLSSFSLLR